jgi:hypothetical protein
MCLKRECSILFTHLEPESALSSLVWLAGNHFPSDLMFTIARIDILTELFLTVYAFLFSFVYGPPKAIPPLNTIQLL